MMQLLMVSYFINNWVCKEGVLLGCLNFIRFNAQGGEWYIHLITQ